MTPTVNPRVAAATESIIGVGGGRGFLLGDGLRSYVVTAAHCLTQTLHGTKLPLPRPDALPSERTYPNLFGPLDEPATISAECLFVDPIADLAVLGAPMIGDEESDAFGEFMEERDTLRLGTIELKQSVVAWLLTLDGEWRRCTCEAMFDGRTLRMCDASIEEGMSGSPILADDGTAIGVVCMQWPDDIRAGLQPWLAKCFPGWLLSELREREE